jgi:hypothetical protein
MAGHHGRPQQLLAAGLGPFVDPHVDDPLRARDRRDWQQQGKGRKSAAHHGDYGYP